MTRITELRSVVGSRDMSGQSAKSLRTLRAVFALILASALALMTFLSPARADTYTAQTLYWVPIELRIRELGEGAIILGACGYLSERLLLQVGLGALHLVVVRDRHSDLAERRKLRDPLDQGV
jgi:hypothetical protein